MYAIHTGSIWDGFGIVLLKGCKDGNIWEIAMFVDGLERKKQYNFNVYDRDLSWTDNIQSLIVYVYSLL